MPLNLPSADKVLDVIEKLKRILVRPWYGTIALLLAGVGVTAIAPGSLSFFPWAWCVFSKQDDLTLIELGETCILPDEVISGSLLSIGIGFILVFLAAWIVWLNLRSKPPQEGVTMNIPKVGLKLQVAVKILADRNGVLVELEGLDQEEYEELVVDGSILTPIGYKRNVIEFINALVPRLHRHKFSKITAQMRGKVLLIRALST